MRFYKSDCLEHIGFDFYCDIANNIVKARKDMGLTQKELAKLAGIKEHRLVGIENVKSELIWTIWKSLRRCLRERLTG